jgi:hypothetical protein
MSVIKQALDKYAAVAMRKDWGHDRSLTVGASEVGQCARRVWYEKDWLRKNTVTVNWVKVDRPSGRFRLMAESEVPEAEEASGYGALLRGNIVEERFWVPALRKRYGKKFLYAGRSQRTLVSGALSSTSDGLVVGQPRDALKSLGISDIGPSCCFAVECKTIDPRVNLPKEKTQHHFQTQVQMGLYREQTEHKPDYCVVSYIDMSFWDKTEEFAIRFEPSFLEVARKRVDVIFAAEIAEDLDPEGWIAGGKECDYCPYRKPCGRVRADPPAGLGPIDDEAFKADLIVHCQTINNQAKIEKGAAENKRRAQELVKGMLRDKGLRRWPGIVSWSPLKGRESFDMVALRAEAEKAGIDVKKFSTVGEPSDRLEVLF